MSLITIRINGIDTEIEEGISLAAALINAGVWGFRVGVDGGARSPICAMGICYECRVAIDGQPHRRSCTVTCAPGMEVTTGG